MLQTFWPSLNKKILFLRIDSTATTTEYESANENDNCSNRVSTSTDIWYDFSSSVKSLVNEATNLEDLSVDNSSSEVSRLINGICENSSSGFVAVPECCGDSLPEWRSSPKQETFHDLSNFLQDVGANLVVRAKSSNDDEFVKENYDLIRNWHRRTSNDGDTKNRSERVKKTTKTKAMRRKRSCKQHCFRRGCKFNGGESTISSKEENEFDEMADALARALDQVSIILETPAAAKTYDYEIITSLVNNSFDGNPMVLWNLEIINFLNDRLVYSAVFQFSYDNVYVFCDDDSGNSQKLCETFVRRFLSQDSYYENLNLVVFRMKCQLKRLHYMVEIPRENMLQDSDEFFVEPKIDFGAFSTNKNFVKKIASNSSSHDLPSSGVQVLNELVEK